MDPCTFIAFVISLIVFALFFFGLGTIKRDQQ